MSLPASFSTSHDYFLAAIDFLKSKAWIYQHANTSFLRAGVLESFPRDYIDYFLSVGNDELNRFPFVHAEEETAAEKEHRDCSKNLQSFRQQLKKLIPAEAFRQPAEENLPQRTTHNERRLNAKKRYEMSLLPPLIAEMCGGGGGGDDSVASNVLIDFGSGLGYLTERVHQLKPCFRILGLEADSYRVEAAQKRLREYLPESEGAIIYKREFITEASGSLITESAKQLVAGAPLSMAIIGLHTCGDLSITSMRLFLRMRSVRRLIVMPCCYHKLQMSAEGQFVNFPLSACLKNVVSTTDATAATGDAFQSYLNRPFLRLASQQSCYAWHSCSASEHAAHGRRMFWRAVADAMADDEAKVVQFKPKGNLCQEREEHRQKDEDTFAALCRQYALISKDSQSPLPWTQQHEAKFNAISDRYAGTMGHKLAEGLTCLQTSMQKLCENLVLYDRLCYIREYAEAEESLQINVRFEKLLNEKLSPRCYVLIAEKF